MGSSEFSRLRFLNRSGAEIWHELRPTTDERTSYYFVASTVSDRPIKLSRGAFEDGNQENPDLIAGIHIQKSGIIFIEALNPTQNVRLARTTDSKPAPTKQSLPCSNSPAKERMLVLLDSDATIYTKYGAAVFKLGAPPISADGDSETTPEEEEVQVLVQQSFPQDSLRRSESDVVRSTPAIPETITEEPRVHETPSVKSRFMNPDSAKVTLPRAGLPRVDTFWEIVGEDGEPTPTGKKSTTVISPSKKGIIPGTAQIIPRIDSNVSPVANTMTPIDLTSPEEKGNGGKEFQSSTEAVRKQLSESAMITSFGSAMDEIVASVVDEDEEGRLSDESITPKNRTKGHGVPEGFLHEEHKKEVTPKIVYGKNKRKAPAPRNKKATTKSGRKPDNIIGNTNDSEVEITKDAPTKRRRPGRPRANSGTDESVEEDAVKVLLQMKEAKPTEGEDIAMETADEEDEVLLQPPPRTQRGRKTVQSLPSTAVTVDESAAVTGRPTRGKRAASTKNAEKTTEGQEKESDVEEVVPTKPLKGTKGKGRAEKAPSAPDPISTTASEEPPEAPNPNKFSRKRRRPDGAHEDENQGSQELPQESSTESVIQVEQTRSKRVKTTNVEKAPVAKRGKKKDVTPSPPPPSNLLGNTQYKIQDTQSQAPELKLKTPARKRAALSAKGPPARRQKSSSQPQMQETDEAENEGDTSRPSVAVAVIKTRDAYEGDSPKIVFSNSGLDGKRDIEKFLRATGGKKMQNVSAPGVNFLVVGPGELKRTPKLTVGVALGKFIVDDQWLIDSKELGYFLDPEPYIPHDPVHEEAWSFSLATAIDRGRKGLNCVLKDYNVYITPSLVSQLKASKQEDSLVEMLKAAGAGTVVKRVPKGKREDDEHADQTLILGTEKGDSDTAALNKAGWSVYGTGIIAISVLRGALDLGTEFKIAPSEVESTPKTGRGRKAR